MGLESGGQKTEVRQEEFALVEFGTGEQAAAIIEHIEHGKGELGVGKPAVRRGVELPEFADLSALPAAHGGQNFFWREGVSQLVGERPAANLGAVELEGVQAEGFGSGEAVRARRRAGQTFFEQVNDGLRPRGGMIATGSTGRPEGLLYSGARGVVSGGQSVKATAGDAELAGGLGRVQGVLPEAFEHMADEGGRVTMNKLLVFFKDAQDTRDLVCTARLFVGHRFARPPTRRAVQTRKVLFC